METLYTEKDGKVFAAAKVPSDWFRGLARFNVPVGGVYNVRIPQDMVVRPIKMDDDPLSPSRIPYFGVTLKGVITGDPRDPDEVVLPFVVSGLDLLLQHPDVEALPDF